MAGVNGQQEGYTLLTNDIFCFLHLAACYLYTLGANFNL